MSEEYIKLIEEEFEKLKTKSELFVFFKEAGKLKQIEFEDKEFLVDQFRWTEVRSLGPESWMAELVALCTRIESGRAVLPEFGMFFIRLHGLLIELPPYFESVSNSPKIFESLPDFEKSCSISRKILNILLRCFETIEFRAIEFVRNKK